MKNIQRKLDDLLDQEIITGYNYFPQDLKLRHYSLILSNVHETQRYFEEAIHDLYSWGYPDSNITINLRKKFSLVKWDISYRIRDDKLNLFPRLKIRHKRNYLQLDKIHYKTLEEAGFKVEEPLIGETEGYEIALLSDSVEELKVNAKRFIQKSNPNEKDSWHDAYVTPFILILGELNNLKSPIEGFSEAQICKRNLFNREYSFVYEKIDPIVTEELISLRYKFFPCLVNNAFLKKKDS